LCTRYHKTAIIKNNLGIRRRNIKKRKKEEKKKGDKGIYMKLAINLGLVSNPLD
jgi:hypothetical protein